MSIESMKDIREFITTQMERAANGEITPANANASANLAGKLVSTFKLEMDYARIKGETPHVDMIEGDYKPSTPALEHKKRGRKRINHSTGEVYN